MGLDGTIYDVPDSEANAAVFARPRQVYSVRPFPQARKLSLVEMGTHVEVAMVVRSSAHGEQSMFAGLFRHLTSEMLLLWDRGFFSYELWQQMTVRTVTVLARVKSGLISARSTTWPTARIWQRFSTTENAARIVGNA